MESRRCDGVRDPPPKMETLRGRGELKVAGDPIKLGDPMGWGAQWGWGTPPKMGILWGVWWVRRDPPCIGRIHWGGGAPPKQGPYGRGSRMGLGHPLKMGNPMGIWGGFGVSVGHNGGRGGCGALTTSRKKSTWGRLCTKNLTGCLSMTTFGGAKGGQPPHGDPPPYFINAPQPI